MPGDIQHCYLCDVLLYKALSYFPFWKWSCTNKQINILSCDVMHIYCLHIIFIIEVFTKSTE